MAQHITVRLEHHLNKRMMREGWMPLSGWKRSEASSRHSSRSLCTRPATSRYRFGICWHNGLLPFTPQGLLAIRSVFGTNLNFSCMPVEHGVRP